MKITTSLTLRNAAATAAVFILCLTLIYVISQHDRVQTFSHDLKGEAITKAHLFLNGQVDAETMQSIYLNNRRFIDEVEVAVYTTDFRMLYHDAIDNDIIKEDRAMIDRILKEKEIDIKAGEYQGIGLVYNFAGRDYVVTAAAYDGYGHNSMHELFLTLITLFLVGLSLLVVVGYLLARTALRPVKSIADTAGRITEAQLDQRLPVRKENDELDELSKTFNDLLERLERSFASQKSFVSNVSHEIKTPLAAIIAELDLALQKERTSEQYRSAISNALNDAHGMTQLTDGLLNLAKADYSPEKIRLEPLRLDELLLDITETILRGHPDYHVEILFALENEDDDRLITVIGNRYLLTVALSNLIDNNCKYSENHTSVVQISNNVNNVIMRFSDTGKGMSETEHDRIFDLFYRGDDCKHVKGYGIGMTLALKIMSLHHGTLDVLSCQGKGTTFIVSVPHLKTD
ncbi:MAG: HAMP domain-containing histidine kinase [Paramuribaculum sp.]|nr:HAMP domain-containing histidine kinase [Paramuribaculum sp.]